MVVPGCLVSNPDPRLWAKEGRNRHTRNRSKGTDTQGGIDGPLMRQAGGQSGRALGRKEGGKRGERSLGNKKPRRVEPTGRGEWIGFIYRCPRGRTRREGG